jgi:hypothetical protein
MAQNDGDDVIQLLIETGVLTPEDASSIKTVHTEVILRHMKEHDVLSAAEEEEARDILSELANGGPPIAKIRAKVRLVRIITNNIHRRIDRQHTHTQEQNERITGEAFPMVARLAKTTE